MSGMNMTRAITFDRMKKNPNKVIILGASHKGSSCTKPFHCIHCQELCGGRLRLAGSIHSA